MAINSARFAQILASYFPQGVPPALISLSGGVDSMCLTYLLAKHRDLYQADLKLHAVTMDHGYRQNSYSEALEVGEIVSQWGVAHSVIKLNYSQDVTSISNFEEQARGLRIQALQNFASTSGPCKFNHIFLAHTLDDQLETYLLRLKKNSLLYGLRSIRPVTKSISKLDPYMDELTLVRPLLKIPKSDIINTCQENSIPWFEDPTNKDTKLTMRNEVRHIIHNIVPSRLQKEPELQCMTYTALKDTYETIETINNRIDSQVFQLQTKLKIADNLKLDTKVGTLKIVLDYQDFTDCDVETLSRLLFYNLSPISSSTHYHWKYANLERKLVPFLKQKFQEHMQNVKINHQFKTNILNVEFDVFFNDTARKVVMYLKPQTPNKKNKAAYVRNAPLNKWFLYDNRIWIKINTNNTFKLDTTTNLQINIEPYNPVKHKYKLRQVFPDFAPSIGENIQSEPLISIGPSLNDSNGQIYDEELSNKLTSEAITANDKSPVGKSISYYLPTRDLYSDQHVNIEYRLKANSLELTQDPN